MTRVSFRRDVRPIEPRQLMAFDAPIALGGNSIARFYRGGERIAALRGVPPSQVAGPEDWVGSTTTTWGDERLGLSRLPDGRILRDVVRAEPEAVLGPLHVARYGAEPALLVKLLDAGERLAVHFHPDAAFAGAHLGLGFGKTEAWIILETAADDALVHVGFREPVDAATLRTWVDAQDVAAMLAALNPVPVAPGDALLVSAGVPHAIGEGILMLELQEPTDLSIMLEWPDPTDPDRLLGLGVDTSLEAVDRSAWRPESFRGPPPGAGIAPLLPAGADAFFRAEHLAVEGELELDEGFSIVLGLEGEGEIGGLKVRRGATLLIPHAAGPVRTAGTLRALRCRPPSVR
jgi:mannose-6-phosphate isomerase